jgi:hypothetical protein
MSLKDNLQATTRKVIENRRNESLSKLDNIDNNILDSLKDKQSNLLKELDKTSKEGKYNYMLKYIEMKDIKELSTDECTEQCNRLCNKIIKMTGVDCYCFSNYKQIDMNLYWLK